MEDEDAEVNYEWRDDISDIASKVANGEITSLAFDTETTGLKWYRQGVRPITCQISWQEGHAVVFPTDALYGQMSRRQTANILADAKVVLETPGVMKAAHNLKFDVHMMRKVGVEVADAEIDTQLLAFMVDENMRNKGLDDWCAPLGSGTGRIRRSV